MSVDIKALARLARIDVSEEELVQLEKQIPTIIAFVDQVQEATSKSTPNVPKHRNVLREDENPHESGVYTEALLAAAPQHDDTHVIVKQVISGGKHAQ